MPATNAFRPTPHFRARRRRGLARAALIDGEGQERTIIVQDASAQGVSAVVQGAPPVPGTLVAISLADGRMAWGLVRWADGHRFGVEFDAALEPPAGLAP